MRCRFGIALVVMALAAPTLAEDAAPIEVGATKPGLTRITAQKCAPCHKEQFKSWSEGKHAGLKPPLDCESCHGPGSEYKVMAVMKDPAKAKAAGLVTPTKEFCTKQCHQKDWKDDMIDKTHAHKVKK